MLSPSIKVTVRNQTFVVNVSIKAQTVLWFANFCLQKYTQQMCEISHLNYCVVDVRDCVSGVRLMPSSTVQQLLEWYPKLHLNICIVDSREFPFMTSRYSPYLVSRQGRPLSDWELFTLPNKAFNIQFSTMAKIVIVHTLSDIQQLCTIQTSNMAVTMENIDAVYVVLSNSSRQPIKLQKKNSTTTTTSSTTSKEWIWTTELTVSTEDRFLYTLDVDLKKETKTTKNSKNKNGANESGNGVRNKANYYNFVSRKQEQNESINDIFDNIWNSEDLQRCMKQQLAPFAASPHSGNEGNDNNDDEVVVDVENNTIDALMLVMKKIASDNWKNLFILFRQLCASDGDPCWLSSNYFRRFVRQCDILPQKSESRASVMISVWNSINTRTQSTLKVQVDGQNIVIKDGENMDISEFVEAIVRLVFAIRVNRSTHKSIMALGRSRRRDNGRGVDYRRNDNQLTMCETFQFVINAFVTQLISCKILDLELLLEKPFVNEVLTRHRKQLSKMFSKYKQLSASGDSHTIELREFQEFVKDVIRENIFINVENEECPKILSKEDFRYIFYSAQSISAKQYLRKTTSNAELSADDYVWDIDEFFEGVVRTAYILFKKLGEQKNENQPRTALKKKAKRKIKSIPNDISEQIMLFMTWVYRI